MNCKNINGFDVTTSEGFFEFLHYKTKHNIHIDEKTNITANKIVLGNNVTIGPNVNINVRDTFELGDCGYIGNDVTIDCKNFKAGNYLFMVARVEVGRGGSRGPNSTLAIGNGCMVCEDVVLNVSDPITIGDNVGIGAGASIWTHGSFLDVMRGFPSSFGPVSIGNDVWLTGNSTVLPGVTIGNNVVVSMNSLVNRNLPDGCLAGGTPCKILKENVYPRELSREERVTLLDPILNEWFFDIAPTKGIRTTPHMSLSYRSSLDQIYLNRGDDMGDTVFNLKRRSITGHQDNISEDLRDFLRRKGIKFFTGNPFISMPII